MTHWPDAPYATLGELAALIPLAGGIRTVAKAAGVDPANLSRYVRGQGGLSVNAALRVEAALGRPGGRPDPARVVQLTADRINADVEAALRWFFPDGAEVAYVVWGHRAHVALRKVLRGNIAPDVAALRAEGTRCVLRCASGHGVSSVLPAALPNLRWAGGTEVKSILNLADPIPWALGQVDSAAFDAAWPGLGYQPSAEELLTEVRNLGLTYAEAIRILHRAHQQSR